LVSIFITKHHERQLAIASLESHHPLDERGTLWDLTSTMYKYHYPSMLVVARACHSSYWHQYWSLPLMRSWRTCHPAFPSRVTWRKYSFLPLFIFQGTKSRKLLSYPERKKRGWCTELFL